MELPSFLYHCLLILYHYIHLIDIPECTELSDACGKGAICTEIPGSYKCSCPKGFHFGYRKRNCFRKYYRLSISNHEVTLILEKKRGHLAGWIGGGEVHQCFSDQEKGEEVRGSTRKHKDA